MDDQVLVQVCMQGLSYGMGGGPTSVASLRTEVSTPRRRRQFSGGMEAHRVKFLPKKCSTEVAWLADFNTPPGPVELG